jgi:hypothetical protein
MIKSPWKLGAWAALSIAAVACDVPPPSEFEVNSADITSGAVYTLKALNSGLCVDVTGASTADGALVEQWNCNGGTNQQWKFVDTGSGVFEVRSVKSNKCLHVAGDGTVSGAAIDQFTCSGKSSQHWTLTGVGTNQYTLRPKSNTAECLDVYAASTVAGGKIDEWSCNGHTSQTFTFALVSSGGTGGTGGSGGSGGTGGTPTPSPTIGNFPARFSAPYVPTWNDTNLVNLSNGTGNKFWTLAFILGSGCNPNWNGDTSLTGNSFGTYINNLRGIGGDVIVSFGGAAGSELARTCSDVASTQAAYQKVINQFKLKWLDLDIEGATIGDTAATDRRNKAMHNLQVANPGLHISYTLAVDRTGLGSPEQNLLKNAKANGVTVNVVNIMAMDYGPCYTDMGQAAVDAAKATRSQLGTLGISAQVGVTPMLGTNDVTCEKFSTSDASVLVNFAQANSFISLLAYWEQSADPNHSYINIFKTFH